MNETPTKAPRNEFLRNSARIILIVFLAASFLTTLAACGADRGETVLTVGGTEIKMDEYRYYYLSLRNAAGGYADEFQNTSKAEIEELLRQKYAIVDLAAEYNVKLDKTELELVKEKELSYLANYEGDEVLFENALKEAFMTREVLRDLISIISLDEKLRYYAYEEMNGVIISDDATVESYIKSDFLRAKHILIKNDAGEDYNANLNLAKEILEKINGGADFDALLKEHNEDIGMTLPDGYYFARGQMFAEFEKAVLELEYGEMSGIVTSSAGYHIIVRLPIEDEYIDSHFENLRDIYLARKYNDMVEARAKDISVTYSKYYDGLTDEDFSRDANQNKG